MKLAAKGVGGRQINWLPLWPTFCLPMLVGGGLSAPEDNYKRAGRPAVPKIIAGLIALPCSANRSSTRSA